MAEKSGRITIVDVATAAGTSVSSASVALSGKPGVSEQTRTHILSVAESLGYQPDQRAQLLRRHRSRLLGVTFSAEQTFHSAVIENLYRAADASGYNLVLSATTASRSESQAVDNLLRNRCDVLILISPELSEAQLADLGTRASVVTIGSDLQADGVDSVHADDRQGVTDAVDHLVGLGHRDITYIDGGASVMSSTRREAYVAAMRAHGLGEQAEVITTSGPTEEAGVEIATRLLDRGTRGTPLPTAVFAHNDMIALGLLLTLRSRGVAVPDEVSVVGFDNTRIAALATVQLTSVSQDAARLARTAVERAVARTETPAPAREIVTPARLVTRATSGPPQPRRPQAQ